MAISKNRVFLINASSLLSGTVVAQAVTFGFSFLITRLYGPSDFGHYSVFTGFASVAGTVSTGSLDRAILLARTDREARKIATTTFTLAVVVAALTSIIGLLIPFLGVMNSIPLTITDFTIYLPFFMLCYAGGQVFTYTTLRESRNILLAKAKILQSTIVGCSQALLSHWKGLHGLIIGFITGWFLLLILGLRWRRLAGYVRNDLHPRSLRTTIVRYWRYPRYVMPNEALDIISNQMPIIMIGMYLSISAAGHYGLAIMMLSGPSAIIGQALGQAFFQHIGSVERDPRTLERTMIRIWLCLFLLGALPFSTVIIFGPQIFAYAFGENWLDAGQVARYLAPLLFVRFISSPTSTIYLKLHMQKTQWKFCVAATIYRTISYGILGLGLSIKTAVITHVVCEMCAIVAYNHLALSKLRNLERLGGSTAYT